MIVMNGIWSDAPKISNVDMAKFEIHHRFGFIDSLWWKFMPGVEIIVKWPVGYVVVGEDDPRWDWTLSACNQQFKSADPNDHWRPWLEKNVGKQGWDWNWKLGAFTAINNDSTVVGTDFLVIKFRKKKSELATIFKLMYG